jgi:non-ribosomal peptide synthetase component F/acyl carrier protein
MTSGSDPQHTRVLYERTRALRRAVKGSSLELEELRAEVRTALAVVQRAPRSWAARSYRSLRWLGPTPDRKRIAPHADELEAAAARLEALYRQLSTPVTDAAATWLETDTDSSIPERFAQQAARRPDHLAIADTAQPLTYSQLQALADRYAELLLERGGDRGQLALLFEHGPQVVAGALGALQCGMAVVTLNATEPPARLADIRRAADASLLLTDELHAAQGRAAGFADSQIVQISARPITSLTASVGARIEPDTPAFMICTSGSTGRPKVVIQTHRNMLHNVLRYTNGLRLGEDDRVAWLASLSGGQGLATTLSTLLNGATLCPFPIAERGVTGLADWLDEHRITVFDTLPSVLRNFSRTLGERRFTAVRLVRLASEPAMRNDFDAFRRHFSEDCELASVLGSSEAGIIAQSILRAQDNPPEGRLTVGDAAEGIEVRLEGDGGRSIEEGQAGEIVVHSRYLSPGYFGDEALTSERFESIDSVRRFRTGDLARRSAGLLTVVGRADGQVKIRGHRLQLEEVEAALARQPDVSGATAVAHLNARGDAKLIAYLTMTPGSQLDVTRLRRSLAAILAPHAVPSAIVRIDALPLTPHGKVDRERLASMKPATPLPREPERDRSETEERLLGLWRSAFEHSEIGVEDGFLELAGDSLTAAVIAANIRELFGVEFGLREFASNPTVAKLASLIEERLEIGPSEPEPPPERASQTGPVPLSYAQEAMWPDVHDKAAGFNIALAYRIDGPLETHVLRDCLEQIVQRHEILRTVFPEREGGPVQLVRAVLLELALEDLSAEPDPPAAAARIVAREAAIAFDPSARPPLSMKLLHLGDEEHQLLIVSHHLICDALSWRVFFEELTLLYEARVNGRPSPPALEPQLQYSDYTIWERAVVQRGSARWERDIAWWEDRFQSPAPPLELPFSPGQPNAAGRSTSTIELRPATALSTRLDTIARDAAATSFMGRLAAFAALVALETGTDDLVLNTYATARRHAALHRMIGPFINRALLRIRFSGAFTFADWLPQVRDAVLDTSEHMTIPFDHLWRELHRRGIRRPPAHTKFEAQYRVPTMRFAGLELEALTRHYVEPWGFTLGVEQHEGSDCWRAVFDPLVYDAGAVERFLEDLEALVSAMCKQPNRPIQELHPGRGASVRAFD